MAKAFRRSKKIIRIFINNHELKLSQYSDDTTLILDGSQQSLEKALRLMDIFGSMSGLRLNCSSKAKCDLELCPEKKFQMAKRKSESTWSALR